MNEKGGAEIAVVVVSHDGYRQRAFVRHFDHVALDVREWERGIFPPGVPNSVRDDLAEMLMFAEVGNLKRPQSGTSADRSIRLHNVGPKRPRGTRGQTAKPRRSLPTQRNSRRTATTASPVASPIHIPIPPSGVKKPKARPTGAPIAQ